MARFAAMLLAIAVGGALAVLIRGTPGQMAAAARGQDQARTATTVSEPRAAAEAARAQKTNRAKAAQGQKTKAAQTAQTTKTAKATNSAKTTKSKRSTALRSKALRHKAARSKATTTASSGASQSTEIQTARTQHETRRVPDPYLSMPGDADDTPAHRYGQLSQAECEAELVARHVAFIRETASSVLAPVRLTGPLRGVLFRSNAKDRVRATSPYEIVDCRLVLALDDFAQILNRHDIVEVRHYSMYRPPRTELERERGTRHPAALAIDTGLFIDRTGAVLDVDRDFHGAIDAATCGEGAAPDPATAEALALRAILCETAGARLFNVVLTPNYNRAHQNHFHLEITPGVRWFLLH